ncbi:hypothetical protein V5F40_21630 [Xanthobacter sp. DSM 14520]|uniref:hypothetical protein n=1 Tax=Xanthobacter autotrophicus (strain ATCC BAA-1158 / Py2) TaxID=78245 RepID=UPI0037299D9A
MSASETAAALEAPVRVRRGSSAEWEIRDALVNYLHAQLPEARIIHELVCGGRRVDVAAVGLECIQLFEVKSERDTLERVEGQVKAFCLYGHGITVVAAAKWFETRQSTYIPGPYSVWKGPELPWPVKTWRYPEIPGDTWSGWKIPEHGPKSRSKPPASADLLELLWNDELRVEAARAGVRVSSRSNRCDLFHKMVWEMSGRDVTRAVCRQLRSRAFVEADPPIFQAAP